MLNSDLAPILAAARPHGWVVEPEALRLLGLAGVPVPRFVGITANPAEWIEPLAGEPLTFRTRGVGRPEDVTLVPLYRLYDQRYSVYWRLCPSGEDLQAAG